MNIAAISKRLLGYAGILPTDTPLPPSTAEYLVDSISGAARDICKEAPGLLTKPVGGILTAPQTGTVTVATTGDNFSASGITLPNSLCTVRITGMATDATLLRDGSSSYLVPFYDPALSAPVTVAATVWHDAWKISPITIAGNFMERMTVKVNGRLLDKVGDRDDAMARCGDTDQRRSVTSATGVPLYWWIERYLTEVYVCVYPMPGRRMGIESPLMRFTDLILEANVLTSTADLGFTEEVAADIWLPLAVKRWAAKPLMIARASDPQIKADYDEAMAKLAKLRPKSPPMPDWNT